MDDTENTSIELNGQPVTPDKLNEEKQALPGNKKIVEVLPGKHKTLTRMQE